jgi:hypothetical protein
MSLRDDVRTAQHTEAVARLKRELADSQGQVRGLTTELDKSRRRVQFYERVTEATEAVTIVPWTRVRHPRGLYHATPGLLLSDQHFDEVVDPAQVEGLNAYNREIAELRLKTCLDGTIRVAREFLSGITYDGFFLNLAGDNFSGTIHEEITQTNETPVAFISLLHWSTKLAEFCSSLAEEFGKLHVTGVAGNHGRMTRKPRSKFYAQDNLDWLLYHMLKRDLRTDPRITFTIPTSRDAETAIYNTLIRTTHGDEAKGGDGITGPQVPLAKLDLRKSRRIADTQRRQYDSLQVGHWHRYDPGERRLTNGSLKGIDEYSLGGEFGFEAPKQAFFLTTPEHGISLKAPIFCSAGRKAERW